MTKKICWISSLLSILLLLLPVSAVFANTSYPGFTTWSSKTTAEVNKVWTISFNAPLLETSVNSDTIYVQNSKQEKMVTTVKLSTDGLSVTVTPSNDYTVGDYNLFITSGIRSRLAVIHVEPVIVPFTVVVIPSGGGGSSSSGTPSGSSKNILEVQSTFNTLFSSFQVKTSSNVYQVNINKTNMRYSGNNTYNADVFGVIQGSTITFEAYDQDGKLLQTYLYQF